MYGIADEGGSFQLRSDFVRKYLTKAVENECCTAEVINPIQIFVAMFHHVQSHCVVDPVKLWTGRGVVLPVKLYGRHVYWTEREIRRRRANLFQKNIYNVSLVAHCKSCKMFSVFLRIALLKSVFDYDFLFVTLHPFLEVICMLARTPKEANIEVFLMDSR